MDVLWNHTLLPFPLDSEPLVDDTSGKSSTSSHVGENDALKRADAIDRNRRAQARYRAKKRAHRKQLAEKFTEVSESLALTRKEHHVLRCVGSVNEMQLMFRDASLKILQEAQGPKSPIFRVTESGFSYGEAIMLETVVASAARFDNAALLSKEEAAAFQNQPTSQMAASWLRSKTELERLIHVCEERSARQSSDWLEGMHAAIESCMSDMRRLLFRADKYKPGNFRVIFGDDGQRPGNTTHDTRSSWANTAKRIGMSSRQISLVRQMQREAQQATTEIWERRAAALARLREGRHLAPCRSAHQAAQSAMEVRDALRLLESTLEAERKLYQLLNSALFDAFNPLQKAIVVVQRRPTCPDIFLLFGAIDEVYLQSEHGASLDELV